MLIIGIDPGVSGSICFLRDGKILDVIEMPVMNEGKKNKKQVNGAQIYNEITKKIIRRHPQIFDINYNEKSTPKDTWEKIKLEEKQNKKSKFKITNFKSLKRDSIINLYNCKFYFFLRIKINLLH